MDSTSFDSLTPSERTVLRALLAERDQKAVARTLGLSPETVKTHLRNAREKCGAATSFSLARAFALHERRPPEWGIPPEGVESPQDDPGIDPGPARPEADYGGDDELREPRRSFVFDYPRERFGPGMRPWEGSDRTIVNRMFAIVGLVVLLALLIILAFPLSESFQRLANLIDPPTT